MCLLLMHEAIREGHKSVTAEAGGCLWGCGTLEPHQAHSPICFLWHVSHFLKQRKRPGVAGGGARFAEKAMIQKGEEKIM